MDSPLDIERQKYAEYLEQLKFSRQDYCEECEEHNANCPFYDPEQESWDYDECFEARGF